MTVEKLDEQPIDAPTAPESRIKGIGGKLAETESPLINGAAALNSALGTPTPEDREKDDKSHAHTPPERIG